MAEEGQSHERQPLLRREDSATESEVYPIIQMIRWVRLLPSGVTEYNSYYRTGRYGNHCT